MNYLKIYDAICNIGKIRGFKPKKGYELHHIIPACYFKSRKIASYKENLCLLTPKEHYIVHHCLAKQRDPKMIYSFYRLINCKYNFKITLKEYENLRLNLKHDNNTIIKIRNSQIGEKNSMYGKKHTVESILKMKENRKGIAPWNKGIKRT